MTKENESQPGLLKGKGHSQVWATPGSRLCSLLLTRRPEPFLGWLLLLAKWETLLVYSALTSPGKEDNCDTLPRWGGLDCCQSLPCVAPTGASLGNPCLGFKKHTTCSLFESALGLQSKYSWSKGAPPSSPVSTMHLPPGADLTPWL